MICSSCGAENDSADILCEQCGERLQSAPLPPSRTWSGQFLLLPVSGGAPIDLGERAVVGRMNTCDVSVPDKSVSREHARLSRLEGAYLLEDLQSTNGTLVNGYRITEATVVRPGDVVTFGTVDFRMEGPGEEPDTTPEVVTAPDAQEETAGLEPSWEAGLNGGSADEFHSAPVTEVAPGLQSETIPLAGAPAGNQVSETGHLADEVVATAAHLSDLVQKLADASAAQPPAAEPAGDVPERLTNIRDAVASIPAPPMTDEEFEQAREILEGLATNPKDFDLLMRVREMAPQLYRVVQQYGQLEHVLNAVQEAAEQESAS